MKTLFVVLCNFYYFLKNKFPFNLNTKTVWKASFVICLFLYLPEKVFAQVPETDFEILDVEDENDIICWPAKSAAKAQATTDRMRTDTTGGPAPMAGGLATPRKLYNALLKPTFFPNPDTVEVFDLVGNPLIINGDTIKFIPSPTATSLATAAIPIVSGSNTEWVGYESNTFQPEKVAVYYYNLYHRWYNGLPCNYDSYGGKQWNGDNTNYETTSDTIFNPHPVTGSILQSINCYGGNNGVIQFSTNPSNHYLFSLNGAAPQTGNTFSNLSAGTYTISIADSFANSCDTVITLTQPSSTGQSDTINNCGVYSWSNSGLTYTSSGVYFFNTSTPTGCPKQDTLFLTVSPNTTNSSNIVSYNFYTWPVNGVTYTASGTYFNTAVTSPGCQTFSILNLNIIASPFNMNLVVDQPISCFGNNDGSIQATAFPMSPNYTYTLNGGAQVNNTGFFAGLPPGTHTVCVSNGASTNLVCKTITLVQPTPLAATIVTDSLVSCLGNDGGLSAIASGGNPPYSYYWFNSANILLNPTNFQVTAITGLIPGIYKLTVEDNNGCFFTMYDTLYPSVPLSVTATVEPINCNGVTTTIVPISTGGIAPITYTINGLPVTASYPAGTYTLTATDAQGCVANTLVDFGQPAPISSFMSASACGSYYWSTNATTYTATGVYVAVLATIGGCNIVAVLQLTINNSTASTSTATACNSYTWPINSMNYTASGTYTATSLNPSGCLHTSTLNLIINQNTTNSKTAVACNTYTWTAAGANNPYTASGIYTATSINAHGCLHTETLFLTINNSTASTNSATACNSYTWPASGLTYTASGTYTTTGINAQGCLHTAILILTINNSTTSTSSVTACNSYAWPASGLTYTSSGIYVSTSLNASGCVHTATLNLTINNSTASTSSATACNSYTWPASGLTYTASGTYTTTGINAQGCLHTAILILTINNSTTSTSSVTACNSYAWPASGLTYTLSGIYVSTSLNASGCVHTATLNLTINNNTSSTTSVTACDSYTWIVSGTSNTTYTASGIYTKTVMNAVNCVHTLTLNLTIKHSSTSITNANANNGYVWNANATTYTQSGVYTATLLNAAGCDSVLTINLIINQIPSTLNLRCFIEGYMEEPNLMRAVLANQSQTGSLIACDSITVELHSNVPPYNIMYQTKVLMNRSGFSNCTFPPLAAQFYIVVKHRNGLQTWSALPVFIGANPVNYNFTNAANKAYGANQIQVSPGVWAFYSGDIDNDENIALVDEGILLTDVVEYVFGYNYTSGNTNYPGVIGSDLDGDGSVDLLDIPYVEINNYNFITTDKPN